MLFGATITKLLLLRQMMLMMMMSGIKAKWRLSIADFLLWPAFYVTNSRWTVLFFEWCAPLGYKQVRSNLWTVISDCALVHISRFPKLRIHFFLRAFAFIIALNFVICFHGVSWCFFALSPRIFFPRLFPLFFSNAPNAAHVVTQTKQFVDADEVR